MADTVPVPLPSSAAGRTSGKGWKDQKTPTVFVSARKRIATGLTTNLSPSAYSRSQQSEGHKTKWQERMNRTKKELAVKKLQQELRQEKEDDRRR